MTDTERIAVLESKVGKLESGLTEKERINALEARVAELESDLSEVYTDLDNRIEQITKSRSENIAVFGIAAAIIIGVVQILIALVK